MGAIAKNMKKNLWFLAYKERSGDIFDLSGLTIVDSPPNTYFADPFLIDYQGSTYVFFEYYDYDKGRIAYSEIIDGELGDISIAIEKDHHLSFPSVVELFGEVYMVPEQGLSGKLEIYKATQFPDKWEVISKVADGSFADPILSYEDKSFILNCSDSDNRAVTYRSKYIEGPWELIKSEDEPYYRPAGHPFMWKDRLIRPYQDCSKVYGGAIVFKEDDKVIKRIEPDWHPFLTGTHTWNISDKFVIIDGRVAL